MSRQLTLNPTQGSVARMDNKTLRDFFCDPVENDTASWMCEKCNDIKKQAPGRGSTNLINHIRSCVGPGHMDFHHERMREAATSEQITLCLQNIVSDKDRDTFEWMEWAIMKNLHVNTAEDTLTGEFQNWLLSLVNV